MAMNYQIVAVAEGDAHWPHICRHSPQTVRYAAEERDREYRFFAAISPANEFLGLCVIEMDPMSFGPLAGRMSAWLEDIVVLEPCRRRGVGTAMLQAALECAWAAGANHVEWTVKFDNAAAIALCRKFGVAFIEEPESTDEHYYKVVVVRPGVTRDA